VQIGTSQKIPEIVTEPKAIRAPLDPKKVEKKLRLASDLFQFAFEVKCFQIKSRHVELSEREVNHRAYALIEKGCKACRD